MQTLNAIAAICVIAFVVDHFAHDIMTGYALRQAKQELRINDLHDTLRELGYKVPE